MATYGIEEEVFVVGPSKPSLSSLYYLSKLLWKDPVKNYVMTASNFARGRDIAQCLMGGVEVATGIHTSTEDLIEDLKQRRSDLASVSEGLIVPIGHLIDLDTPTNVCALQVHIGNVSDQEHVYHNLVYFLPVLMLLTINSPYKNREYFGQSVRIAKSFAIGFLKEDKKERFQDIIISKRLKTIELRVFDPTWDINRVEVLLNAIKAIVNLNTRMPDGVGRYNQLRLRIARNGFIDELDPVKRDLKRVCNLQDEMVHNTSSDETRQSYEQNGLLATYSAMDNGYRNNVLKQQAIVEPRSKAIKAAAGFAGYYLPKLPYVIWKYMRES